MKTQKDAEAAVQLGSVIVGQQVLKLSWAAVKDRAREDEWEEVRDNGECLFVDALLPIPPVEAIRNVFGARFPIEELVVPEGFNYCIVYLLDKRDSDGAVDELNGVVVEGVKLRVQRAFRRPSEGPRGIGMKEVSRMAITAGPSTMYSVISPLMREKPSVADILNPNVQVAVVVRPETERLQPATGRTLFLYNVAASLVLYDADVCREIVEDIKEECQKFGRVKECEVIKLASEALPSDYAVVKVVFENAAEAKDAQMALAGRRFSGRIVLTQLV
jgi:hypothetical protein